jgi:alanine-synthesizing transaminase
MFARRTEWNLQTNRFTETHQRLRSASVRLLDLTVSNPTEAGLHYDTAVIADALALGACARYTPDPRGLLAARLAVAEYYANLPEPVPVSPEQIILTTSTSEAYAFLFRLLCDPGDEVLVPRPSYPLFDFLAEIQDVKLVPYPLLYDHGWHIDLHALESMIVPRTRAVLVVNPNNPTGSFVSAEESAELQRVAAAHELAIISDEVFLDYSFGPTPVSFTANTEALTFTLSGLSKIAGLPQMKVAWLVASGPPTLVEPALARLEVIADTYLSLSTPQQHANAALLATRNAFQSELRARLAANLAELDEQLSNQTLGSRLTVQGGWYANLRVPATHPDDEIALALMEKKSVVVHPGQFFDFPSEGYLILSLMTPEPVFGEGVRRILSALQSS